MAQNLCSGHDCPAACGCGGKHQHILPDAHCNHMDANELCPANCYGDDPNCQICGGSGLRTLTSGDLPIAQSPAVPSSGTPEPPALAHGPNDEPTDAQAHGGSSKYRIEMTVTGAWMERGQLKQRVIKFRTEEEPERGGLSSLLFYIEQAINSSATAYALRAHIATEEA